MQKKSHKRKFKVGQMVKVSSNVVDGEYKIAEYSKDPSGSPLNYRLEGVNDMLWFSAKELEAVETPEEFFEEKETDGEIARVLLKVLELIPVDEENDAFTSQYTCDVIGDVVDNIQATRDKIIDFLDTLGFESFHSGFRKFSEFEEGFHRQSARFNWILFALTIAREEGV